LLGFGVGLTIHPRKMKSQNPKEERPGPTQSCRADDDDDDDENSSGNYYNDYTMTEYRLITFGNKLIPRTIDV
jgi:hypothetical protein